MTLSLNTATVASWLSREVPGFDPASLRADPIGGGTSNPTFALHTNIGELVLRHAPQGHGLASAHDMVREFRVMAALRQTEVPVPATVALCEDKTVIGAPFYVMRKVDGFVLADTPPLKPMPPGYASTPDERRKIGVALIDALVRLHAVDPRFVGLEDLGRPLGYVERQVKRWTEQWYTWRTRDFPEMDELLRRLNRFVPPNDGFAIVHGDYRLGNVILSVDDPGRVEAILDWEMATLGDPMADLGYTLVYWGEPGDSPNRLESMDLSLLTADRGFLTRRELLEEYARRSGRDTPNVDFFEMLARAKLAVFGERGYARLLKSAAGMANDERRGSRCDAHVREALAVGDASANPLLNRS